MDTDRAIARASLILIIANSSGYALGLVKEIMVANYFGIKAAMDAFYAALTFPTLITNVILNSFIAVFIPVFAKYRAKSDEEARRVASSAANFLSRILIASALLMFLCAPLIIRYSFHGLAPSTAALAIGILRILSVTIVLSGISGALTGILNSYRQFMWPAFSQLCVTAGVIVAIVASVRSLNIYALPVGMCAGLAVQLVVLFCLCRRVGCVFKAGAFQRHSALGEMLPLAGIYLIAIVAAQMNAAVDMIMASYLSAGSIAAMGYANKLVQVPIIVFTGAFATALFPFVSAQAAGGHIGDLANSLKKIIRASGLVSIPATVALIVLAKPLIQILFQRGAFDRSAVDFTSLIFIFYVLQLLFYTIGVLLTRVTLAFQDVRAVARIACVAVAVNIVLNLIFIRVITPPAAGIALSTSCVQILIMFLYIISLKKRGVIPEGGEILGSLGKVAACSLFMGAGMICVRIFVQFPGLLGQIGSVLLTAAAGAAIFVSFAVLLRVRELSMAVDIVRESLGWRKK